MKNKFTLVLTAFVILLGFTACSDKDDELTGDAAKEALIGKWVILSYTDEDGSEDYEHECSSKKDYIEAQNNGTMRSVYYDEACSEDVEIGSYIINGDQLTIVDPDGGREIYTFKISGNDLQLISSDETIRLKKM